MGEAERTGKILIEKKIKNKNNHQNSQHFNMTSRPPSSSFALPLLDYFFCQRSYDPSLWSWTQLYECCEEKHHIFSISKHDVVSHALCCTHLYILCFGLVRKVYISYHSGIVPVSLQMMSSSYKLCKEIWKSSISSILLDIKLAVGYSPLNFPEIIQTASKPIYKPTVSHIRCNNSSLLTFSWHDCFY